MNEFSYYSGGINTTIPTEKITILDLKDRISSILLKSQIEQIQKISESNKKEEKLKRNNLKKYLPYCTPAGIFIKRNKKDLATQSGFAPIDIDDLPEPEKLKEKLKQDNYIKLMYISPSGKGLKLIIEIPINPEEYSARVHSFYMYLEKTYNINIDSLDKSTSDISRACYLSYDPDTYYNENSKTFEVLNTTIRAKLKQPKDESRSGKEWTQILKLLYQGKSKEEIFNFMSDNFEKWNESLAYQEHTYENALSHYESNPPKGKELQELINELAFEIIDKFHIAVLRSDKNSEVYIYHEGIYVTAGRTYLQEYLENSLGKYYTKQIADKVIEKIIPKFYVDSKDFFEEEEPQLVPVQNGILNLFTGELEKFTPEKRFFNKLPIKYNPEASCETTIKHYNTILTADEVPIMQELFGYLLYRKYQFQNCFIFSGEGANGKSATLNQMSSFIGIENMKNIGLKELEEYQFMKGHLHAKLANLADDIGSAVIKESKVIKELTGGSPITADIKHNPDGITFKNYAKLIFNANTIPKFEDDSDGTWRRWIFIRFDTFFLKPTEYKIKEEQGTLLSKHRLADSEIENALTSPEELSGVLNWAIEGLQRLMKQKDFSYRRTMEETKKEMTRYSSRTAEFIYDCLQDSEHPEQYETASSLYLQFREYCRNKKYKNKKIQPENERTFRKIMAEEFPLEKKRIGSIDELRFYYCKFKGLPTEDY